MTHGEGLATLQATGAVALFIPNLAGGGAERVTLNLARGLVGRGYPVDLVLASQEGELRDRVPEGIRIVDLGGVRTMRSLPKLARYLRRERPAGLVSAMNHANVVASWAAKLAGYQGPVVLAEHIQMPERRTSYWQRAFNLAVNVTYRNATRVVAVSEGVKRSLIENAGVGADRISVIYNPVLPDGLTSPRPAARPAAMGKAGTPVILGIGRLEPQKNFGLLIRAFAQLLERRPARLVVLGEGRERPALERQVEELGLHESISLPGFVPDPLDYLAHAGVFVLSSDWEGLPTVLIEALAMGTPVVATDCPSGPREILDGGNYGHLVPMRDARALSDAMYEALTTPPAGPPPSWLEQFSESAATAKYLGALGLPGGGPHPR